MVVGIRSWRLSFKSCLIRGELTVEMAYPGEWLRRMKFCTPANFPRVLGRSDGSTSHLLPSQPPHVVLSSFRSVVPFELWREGRGKSTVSFPNRVLRTMIRTSFFRSPDHAGPILVRSSHPSSPTFIQPERHPVHCRAALHSLTLKWDL